MSLAIAACAAMAIPSATSARLADVVETTQASQLCTVPLRTLPSARPPGVSTSLSACLLWLSIFLWGILSLLLRRIFSLAGTIVRPISGDGTNAVVGLALIGSRPHAE